MAAMIAYHDSPRDFVQCFVQSRALVRLLWRCRRLRADFQLKLSDEVLWPKDNNDDFRNDSVIRRVCSYNCGEGEVVMRQAGKHDLMFL
jgi:hypothetical protein